jgi:hypothetical protein
MRYPTVFAAMILSVACYFALFWGLDGLRVLGSPTYGLDDFWRSRTVYWIARWGEINGQDLLNLAALFGLVKLAVAGLCIAHLVDCIRNGGRGCANSTILELALLLVVALSIIMVLPAIWQHDATLIRSCVVNLVLASIAAALGALELTRPDISANRPIGYVTVSPMKRSIDSDPQPARIAPAA